MALKTWKPNGGGGFRSGSWDPIRDGNGVQPPPAALAPKCPVIPIEHGRALRDRRLGRGQRRPGGSAA